MATDYTDTQDELRRLNNAIAWFERVIHHPDLTEEEMAMLAPRASDPTPSGLFRRSVNRVLPEEPQDGDK